MKTVNPFFDKPLQSGHKSVLGIRFRWPPFSVLNAQTGQWQDRKRQWLSLGIQSELGRGEALTWEGDVGTDIDTYRHKEGTKRVKGQTYRFDDYEDQYRPNRKVNATPGGGPMPSMTYSKDHARGDGKGRPMLAEPGRGRNGSPSTVLKDHGKSERKRYHAQPGGQPSRSSVWMHNSVPVGGETAVNYAKQTASKKDGLTWGTTISPYTGAGGNVASQTGTSIFDPVLCEHVYRWFCPPGGQVIDPFAGGSVRGVMASFLDRKYFGVDLSERQLHANELQAEAMCHPDKHPVWVPGDSRNLCDLIDQYDKSLYADFIFSCPPYFDLELYSDDPRDLSGFSWKKFQKAYYDIIDQCVQCLRNNRFACFVVGDIRDKEGFYRGLCSVTIDAFEAAGCRLYNEAVLITATGSLPLRTQKQFVSSRKWGKTHQQVLVFCKGDPRKAAKIQEPIEILANDLAVTGETDSVYLGEATEETYVNLGT